MKKKTDQAIAEALKTLLAKKPLNKITISDIANECGVNRMTFYYHYRDVYDLIETICDECVARAMEGKKNVTDWQDGIRILMDSMREDKDFFIGVFHSVENEKITDYIYNAIAGVLREGLKSLTIPDGVSEDEIQMAVDFYAYAFTGLLMRWVRNGMTEDVDTLVDGMAKIGKNGLTRAFEAFAEE